MRAAPPENPARFPINPINCFLFSEPGTLSRFIVQSVQTGLTAHNPTDPFARLYVPPEKSPQESPHTQMKVKQYRGLSGIISGH